MIEKSHKFDTDILVSAWKSKNSNTAGLYKSEARLPIIEHLCEIFKADNYSYEDVVAQKSKVIDFLITEKGRKFTRTKGHAYYGWLANSEKDFDMTIAGFFINTDDLEASYFGEQFLNKKPEITEWVEKTFGVKDESLVKETHRFFSHMMVKWAEETLIKK